MARSRAPLPQHPPTAMPVESPLRSGNPLHKDRDWTQCSCIPSNSAIHVARYSHHSCGLRPRQKNSEAIQTSTVRGDDYWSYPVEPETAEKSAMPNTKMLMVKVSVTSEILQPNCFVRGVRNTLPRINCTQATCRRTPAIALLSDRPFLIMGALSCERPHSRRVEMAAQRLARSHWCSPDPGDYSL